MPGSRKETNVPESTPSKRIKLDEDDESTRRLQSILVRELNNEIIALRNDLDTVNQRIYHTTQYLMKVRQGTVAKWYKQNSKGVLQLPPHPAIKDTFHGKCPKKSNRINHVDNSVNTALIVESSTVNNEDNCENHNGVELDETENNSITKIPRYIPPKCRDEDVVKLGEPRGNVKKQKFRISIVNVSKWIYDEQDTSNKTTHKWTVYVKNYDRSLDISCIVSKVVFYLHDSYKPNNVVSVDYSPFKLSRRGWGEFPLRIQLHFKSSLDKPVDVIHELKLNTSHPGIDCFGKQTVIDVWAHYDDGQNEEITTDGIKVEEISSDGIKVEKISSDDTKIEEISTDGIKTEEHSSYNDPNTASPVKPSTSLTDELNLSASLTSQFSLPSFTDEISKEILSEIFDDIKIEESEELPIISFTDGNVCEYNEIKQENTIVTDEFITYKEEPVSNVDSTIEIQPFHGAKSTECSEMFMSDGEYLNVVSNEIIIDDAEDDESIKSNNVTASFENNIDEQLVQDIEQQVVSEEDAVEEDIESSGVKLDTNENRIHSNTGRTLQDTVSSSNCLVGSNILFSSVQASPVKFTNLETILKPELSINKTANNVFISPKKVSPMKMNHSKEINSKIGDLIKNKNEAIIVVNKDEIIDFFCKNKGKIAINRNSIATASSSLAFSSRDLRVREDSRAKPIEVSSKNLLIEMPDGQLRKICSGIVTDRRLPTVSSKPIIIEPQPLIKRRNGTKSSPQNVTLYKINDTQNKKSILLKPGCKIISAANSNRVNKSILLPVKTIQKSQPNILKPIASTSFHQVGGQSSVDGAQFIKVVRNGPLISGNVGNSRRVRPGESLLKKGTVSPSPEVLQTVHATSSCDILSDRELIKRCPSENIEYAMQWFIKHCPLVNIKAGIESYKSKHPYCAADRATFLKWPLDKQRASEWLRAKKVSKLLLKVCPDSIQHWTTYKILEWARLRGYTPLGMSLRCKKVNNVNIDSFLKYTVPDLSLISKTNKKFVNNDPEIDVATDFEIISERSTRPFSKTSSKLYIPMEKELKGIGDYIFRSCDELGYHFYEEELSAGVVYPAAERMLISVFHSIADDLFRRSLGASCARNGVMPTAEVIEDDVKIAILSRDEFDLFTNEGLGKL